MSNINLHSFLKFGYYLDYKPKAKINLSDFDKSKYEGYSEDSLIKIGGDLWNAAIEKKFNSNQKHLVPISGGYDSRGVLAGLHKLTELKNIYAYTFGVSGAYDFEIGKAICKKYGIRHKSYDLSTYQYDLDELIAISKRINHQTVLFHHPPIWKMDEIFADFTVWSGVSIESWFGSHFDGITTRSIEDEKIKYIHDNIYVKSCNLSIIENVALFHLISCPESNYVPPSIVLDIVNRQFKYNIPHVLFKGFKYNVLFDDNNLTNFALSLPNKHLINRYLYHKILVAAYPDWFRLPLKSNYGLNAKASTRLVLFKKLYLSLMKKTKTFINPMINYIDFNEGIREREDLKKIIYSNIMDLKHRKIVDWVNIDKIWKSHIEKKADHADALITLTSLEIHLKAGKKLAYT